jgi:hypothetical protein
MGIAWRIGWTLPRIFPGAWRGQTWEIKVLRFSKIILEILFQSHNNAPGSNIRILMQPDVDLLTLGDLPPKYRAKALADAQPV